MDVFKIDSEFQSLIPPLTDDEFQRLERSIQAEGVREPIITWNGTIIDGHNRYKICMKHGLVCPNRERGFDSRDAAKIWIIENQFGRRNLNAYSRSVLALKLEPLIAAEARRRSDANLKRGNKIPDMQKSSHRENEGLTREKVARVAGVSHDTIRKVKVIENEANSGNETAIAARDEVKSGKKSINKAFSEIRDEGKRLCSVCGKPINEGEYYESKPSMHKRCHDERLKTQQYKNPDISLINNVPVFDIDSLLVELVSTAENLRDSWRESIEINESQGVKLSNVEKKRLEKLVSNIFKELDRIKEEH